MLAALYLVQEQQGHLTANGMRHVAEILEMTPAEVEDVATYYVMFFREKVGKYVLQVCRTLSCALAGAERVTEALAEKLGIQPGETDPSGMFTLLEFECLGACDRAPIVMVNNEHWHEKATAGETVAKLVDDLKARGEAALSGCHLRSNDDDFRLKAEATQSIFGARGFRLQAEGQINGTSSHQVRSRAQQLHPRLLPEAPGLRGPAQGARDAAGRGDRPGQGLGPARPRRRRVSRPA